MHAVETQQMGVGFHRAQIVDGDDLDIGAPGFDDGAHDIAPDAAKAIDCDADSHGMLLWRQVGNDVKDGSYNCALTASTTALAVMPKYS